MEQRREQGCPQASARAQASIPSHSSLLCRGKIILLRAHINGRRGRLAKLPPALSPRPHNQRLGLHIRGAPTNTGKERTSSRPRRAGTPSRTQGARVESVPSVPSGALVHADVCDEREPAAVPTHPSPRNTNHPRRASVSCQRGLTITPPFSHPLPCSLLHLQINKISSSRLSRPRQKRGRWKTSKKTQKNKHSLRIHTQPCPVLLHEPPQDILRGLVDVGPAGVFGEVFFEGDLREEGGELWGCDRGTEGKREKEGKGREPLLAPDIEVVPVHASSSAPQRAQKDRHAASPHTVHPYVIVPLPIRTR